MLGGDSVYLFLKPIGFYRGAPVHAHLRLKGTRWYKRRLFLYYYLFFSNPPHCSSSSFPVEKHTKELVGGKKNRYPTMEFFNSKKKYMQGLIYSSFFFIFFLSLSLFFSHLQLQIHRSFAYTICISEDEPRFCLYAFHRKLSQ